MNQLGGYEFADLRIGMSATFAKTITEADIVLFAAVSGDNNALHINAEYAATTIFETRIAHGMLSASVISAAIANKLPGPGSIYLSQSLRFRAPVRAGDTVHAIVAVTELLSERSRVLLSTECTVRGVVVISGEALVLLPAPARTIADPRAGRTHDRLNPRFGGLPRRGAARPSIEHEDDRDSLEIANAHLLEASPKRAGPYRDSLGKRAANYVPLSPLSFLPKAAAVHPHRIAVVHGAWRSTWAETYDRCRRLASALAQHGVGPGDTVAILAPNVPAMYEAHFGVPMTGAVLNTLNTRLDAEAIAFQLTHGEAKVFITDREFSAVAQRALSMLEHRLLVIDIDDPLHQGGTLLGAMDYEAFLGQGSADFDWPAPDDEFDPIALNYTSGTTGNPKGVVTHHRGAYLNAVSQIISWGMPAHSVYLWTLPMFHCNGWCFPWAMAANAGTNICLRKIDVKQIFEAIEEHHVTHMCGAPIVYNMLINAPGELQGKSQHKVCGYIAGAAPPASTIEGAERIGFDITHVYGLTETYGPASICAAQEEWRSLPLAERARLKARQGVASPMQEAMTVRDPVTMETVPADGETIGEIMFRGNIVMNGYLKNPSSTDEAFAGGWLHTGDLAVIEPDGYVRIKDRSKDVIISGGENISSIELEDVLHRHPAVDTAAVVAKPDPKWGEVPCAFIELRPNATVSEAEIRQFCRDQMAGYKVPRLVVFGPIPKNATGKVQKVLLRERIRTMGEAAA